MRMKPVVAIKFIIYVPLTGKTCNPINDKHYSNNNQYKKFPKWPPTTETQYSMHSISLYVKQRYMF